MGYCLIIAEKPSAAKRIANALADGKVLSKKKRGIYYYLFEKNGKKHIVVPSVGHLYTLNQKGRDWTYPIFDVEWIESYKVSKKSAFSKRYLMNIKDLAIADEYMVATDYDIEGRVIAYNILRFVCGTVTAHSMKFSTLTEFDLNEAYKKASDSLDWGIINSGIARHFLDYYYGINISRSLTLSLNKKRNFRTEPLSAGRVQAPILKILLNREKDIRNFKPKSYWRIILIAKKYDAIVKAVHVRNKFFEETEARKILKACINGIPEVGETRRWQYKQMPPSPFNLTNLQTEAYRLFGFSPTKTQDIAQSLYSRGWISYPRTSSQKLPKIINYRKILRSLSKIREYRELTLELLNKEKIEPIEGKKEDPAHIAIHPTHQNPKRIPQGEKGKLYDLICRRFLAAFADSAIRETFQIIIKIHQERFQTIISRTVEGNWHRFYGFYLKSSEKEFPKLGEGDRLEMCDLKLIANKTIAPSRYTQASLLRTLEEKGLGTKATRAHILKTLYDRGYVSGNNIEITRLGETVAQILEKYFPKIISEELTRETEKKMSLIQQGKLDKEVLINETEKFLTDVLAKFKEKEDEIGESLASSLKGAGKDYPILGECPECGNTIRIIFSKKTNLRFAGCEGYFKGVCSFSSSLPQKGKIYSIDKKCKNCGYPMIGIVGRDSYHTNFLCLNKKCINNKEGKY